MSLNWVPCSAAVFAVTLCFQASGASAGAITSLAGYSGILSQAAPSSADTQTGDIHAPYPSPSAPKTPPPVYKPYTVGQKFRHASTDVFGPVALVAVGVSAGFGQFTNTPSAWGQGAEGYGKRYGSAFGLNLSYEYFDATLNSALREDPRYFPSTDRSAKGRLRHVIAYVFTTRNDNGGTGFAYARWGSALGAGFVANSWNPQTDNHVSDGLQRAGIVLAADAGIHLVEEFIPFFRHLTP